MGRVCGGTDIRLKRGVVVDRTYITHDEKTCTTAATAMAGVPTTPKRQTEKRGGGYKVTG